MTARPNPRTYPELLAAMAATLLTYPDRLDCAMTLADSARSPLRAAGQGAGRGGGDSEPATTHDMRRAEDAYRGMVRCVEAIRDAERALTGYIAEWAPDATRARMFASTTANLPIWCENCLKHGRTEPRRGDGSRLCRRCGDVHRNFGRLPNDELYRLIDRRGGSSARLTEREYLDALGIKKRAG